MVLCIVCKGDPNGQLTLGTEMLRPLHGHVIWCTFLLYLELRRLNTDWNQKNSAEQMLT